MVSKHSKTRLIQGSLYIGQRCPISRRILQPNDEVIICEQSKTAFILDAWRQTLPSWNHTCQFCQTATTEYNTSAKSNTPLPDLELSPTPFYEPNRTSSLRTFSRWSGIMTIVGLVVLASFWLVSNRSLSSTQGMENLSGTTSETWTSNKIVVVETVTVVLTATVLQEIRPISTTTPTLTPMPTSSQTTTRTPSPTNTSAPTYTPTPTINQLKVIIEKKAHSSSIVVRYPKETEYFIASILQHLGEFQLPKLGITKTSMISALNRYDVGDRINALIQEVWTEWLDIAKNKNFDSMTTDPGNYHLSPFRQLVIRMVQGRQGKLADHHQHGLYNFLTRSETPTIWSTDVDSVIGAVNRESFLWP